MQDQVSARRNGLSTKGGREGVCVCIGSFGPSAERRQQATETALAASFTAVAYRKEDHTKQDKMIRLRVSVQRVKMRNRGEAKGGGGMSTVFESRMRETNNQSRPNVVDGATYVAKQRPHTTICNCIRFLPTTTTDHQQPQTSPFVTDLHHQSLPSSIAIITQPTHENTGPLESSESSFLLFNHGNS